MIKYVTITESWGFPSFWVTWTWEEIVVHVAGLFGFAYCDWVESDIIFCDNACASWPHVLMLSRTHFLEKEMSNFLS